MSAATDRVLTALEANGRTVRRNGTGAMAQCPAHEDRTPSLSVSEGAEGRALLNCHGGCDSADVLAALHLKAADLFEANGTKPSTLGPIVARYVYKDATGEPVVRVNRHFPPKDFRQDRNEAGVWMAGTRQIPPERRRIPYHLPELLAGIAGGRTVWIVEGEKDVEAIESVGAVATCNAMGEGQWTPEHAGWLKGAPDVIIVADRDPAGYRHAADVARHLAGVGIEPRFAEAAEGKDAADHLAAGHKLEDFVEFDAAQLAEEIGDTTNAAETPVEPGGRLPVAVDWEALFAREATYDWLIEDVWPIGRQLHIFAARKTGKSLVMLWMAASLAAGKDPFTGDARTPVRTVYLDYEMSEEDLLERVEDMGFTPADLAELRYFLHPALAPLDTAEGGQGLLELVTREEAGAVVIDTVARVVEGEENSADTFRDLWRHTGARIKAAGVSLARLDHEGHEAGRSRGSSAKADDVDVVWRLARADGGYTFTRKAARIAWVPELVEVSMTEAPLAFTRTAGTWPAGTKAVADNLDKLEAPLDISRRAAKQLLEANGDGCKTAVLGKALVFRRQRGPQ